MQQCRQVHSVCNCIDRMRRLKMREWKHRERLILMQNVMLGSAEKRMVWLISREIIFEEFQRISSQSTNVTNRRTDRRTSYHGNTALCYASNVLNCIVVENRHFYRAMHFSAYARSWDRMSSVRPFVRPSVTLVDCDHISWKS